MATFFLMGKYSADAIQEANTDRTEKAISFIDELGGEVKDIYALLGCYDLIIIAELKDIETAMKASLGLCILTGITFSTYPALEVNDFDRILGQV